MDELEKELKHLNLINKKTDTKCLNNSNIKGNVESISSARDICNRKTGPNVPPKPQKKFDKQPQIPQSNFVDETRQPLYAGPLNYTKLRGNVLLKKHLIDNVTSKTTLDNPAVLEQQLEALAYHKKQMEKKGLLGKQTSQGKLTKKYLQIFDKTFNAIPKLSSNSFSSNAHPYNDECANSKSLNYAQNTLSQRNEHMLYADRAYQDEETDVCQIQSNNVYSNICNCSKKGSLLDPLAISTSSYVENEVPPPLSPVSSSYSELRRAIDVSSENSIDIIKSIDNDNSVNNSKGLFKQSSINYAQQNFAHDKSICSSNLQNQGFTDYYGFGGLSQNSLTYDSIYEPINPRNPCELSIRSNYVSYAPYVNSEQITANQLDANLPPIDNMDSNTPRRVSKLEKKNIDTYVKKEDNEPLSDYFVNSIGTENETENYGLCFACNERVLGENSGCTAMDQIYHISCFTCSQCQINLQGKPFYAIDNKPYCEDDYLQTLEKCSVCMKPILERILRATGKPYHPQCFTCVVCGNSLDGIPFTVDATNQNYCITDFHKKFAPRCCVCKDPIMPEPGQDETVRVVALDRSFHLECYKCEDCDLLLSSEAEGRGCYPLDDHVLCKSCNAQRVQLLTNRITADI